MTRFLPPLRTILPAEHGSWFMLGFPMVLGLLLGPASRGSAWPSPRWPFSSVGRPSAGC